MLRTLTVATLLAMALGAHAQEPTNGAAPADATPADASDASESGAPKGPPTEQGPDVAALRSELSTVLDELTQARARASTLVKTLFGTDIEVWVARRADEQRLARIVLKLDGVPVHDSEGAAIAKQEARLFAGYAAPGFHELAIVVTEEAKRDPSYTYTREERFRFEIKKGTSTRIRVLLRDDSDMAEELPEDDDGKYQVSTRVRIERKKQGK